MILLPTQDSCLWSQRPTTPCGSDPRLRSAWHDWNIPYMLRALLMFDLAASGIATIETAVLRLYVTDSTAGPISYLVCRMLALWSEVYACWDLRDAGTPWSTAGGDFTTVGSVGFYVSGNGLLQLDLSALAQYAQEFCSGVLSIIILRAGEGFLDGGFMFESKEGDHPPELEVTGVSMSHRVIGGSVIRGHTATRGGLIT